MASWSAAWPLEWWQQRREEASPRGKRRAPFPGLVSTTLQRNSDCKQTTQPECRNQQTSSLRGPEKHTGAHDPQHALQKNGGLADQWYMDDGDIMCHPVLVLPFLQDFDVANARVGAERNPLKTEVIYHVNDLDASPPEWKNGDVRSATCKKSALTAGSITLGVAVGSRQFITDQLLSKADVIRAMHERVQLCQDPQTEFALLREVWASAVSTHPAGSRPHKSCRNRELSTTRSGSGLSNGSSRVSQDSMTQATLSAGQSGIGFKRARDIAAPAHLGALIAAKPRIQGMIRDAVWAGLLPEQILEARLSEVIETATSTYPSALDNDEQATAKLYVQKAAQAADEAWQQTIAGLQGPGVANPTTALPGTPQLPPPRMEDSDDMDFSAPRKSRLSAPQLQAQLSRLTDRSRLRRLKDTLLSQGCLAAGN